MSNTVKLSSALPADENNNGLDAMHDELTSSPTTIYAAVIMFDVPKIVTDTDTGDTLPYARIRRIEPLGPAADVDPTLVKLFQGLVETRTGRTPLPFGADFEVEAGDE